MSHRLYDILRRWTNATDDEVAFVKTTLMPEDAADNITFGVTVHPNMNPDGSLYISWFDIDVYDRDNCVAIGHITVSTSDGHIEYVFQ
jgi:hypothetical protein